MLAHLRPIRTTWLAAACLPLPVLLMLDPGKNAEVACVYLGIASAWLAGETATRNLPPFTAPFAIAINLALFIALALSVGVKSQIPFPLLATLSTIPAIGLIPPLTRRLGDPYRAILVATLILFAAKITGCAAARIAYGPTFIEAGYVSDDWHSARLMITTFWSLTVAASIALPLSNWFPRRAL